MKILIIASKSYDFIKDETGERLQGAHVHYLDPLMREDTDSTKGLLPLKVPALKSALGKITTLPGLYEAEFRQRPDGKGRPVFTLADAKLVKEVTL